MRKYAIKTLVFVLMVLASVTCGMKSVSAYYKPGNTNSLIKNVTYVTPYKYCGYHPKGIPYTVFAVGIEFNNSEKKCGGYCETIPLISKRYAFACNTPGAKCPTSKQVNGWSLSKYKKTAKWSKYNVRFYVKSGYQNALGKIKKLNRYKLVGVPYEVERKDGKTKWIRSLNGVCGMKKIEKYGFYGKKVSIKVTTTSFPCGKNADGKKKKYKFIGWAKKKGGEVKEEGKTYVKKSIKNKITVYPLYECVKNCTTPPPEEPTDCSGIENPAEYNSSFNTNKKQGWSRVISKIKNPDISKYAEWQDEIYSKPKDTVEWIHCYYPGAQVTAFTTVSYNNEHPTELAGLTFPTTWGPLSGKGGWANSFSVDKTKAEHGKFDGDYSYGVTDVQSEGDTYDVKMFDVTKSDGITESSRTGLREAWVGEKQGCAWGCHWGTSCGKCRCAEYGDPPTDEEGNPTGDAPCVKCGECYLDTCTHGRQDYIPSSVNWSGDYDSATVRVPYNFINEIEIKGSGDEFDESGASYDADPDSDDYANDEDDYGDDDSGAYDDDDDDDSDEEGDDDGGDWDDFRDINSSTSSENGETNNGADEPDAIVDDSEIVIAGETKDIYFNINTLPRENVTLEGTYATRVDNAKWRVRVCFAGGCYDGPKHDVGSLNVGESDTNYSYGSTLPQSVEIYVPDIAAGSYVDVYIGVYPKDSYSDLNMLANAYDVNSDNSWAWSQVTYKVAKKPSLQVWGGNVFSTSEIATAENRKRALRGYNDYKVEVDGSLGNHIFGSWGELGVISNASVVGFASGASTNVWDNGRNMWVGSSVVSFCDKIPLTIANKPCISEATQTLGGLFTGGGSDDDRSRIIDKFVDDTNLEKKDVKTIGEKNLRDRKMDVEMVKGNVYINGNIKYNGDDFAKLKDMPKMVIYAEGDDSGGGNIYISCAVTRIDALLVATGTVKTCAADSNGNEPDVNSSERSRQLRINGAVIASKFEAGRTYGAATGSNTGVPAEVINFDPTLYLWGGDSNAVEEDYNAGTLDVTYIRELAPRL